MPSLIEEKIEEVLTQIRPALQFDGGNIQFVRFDDDTGVVYVELSGACIGCPMSDVTLKMGVEAALRDAVPEVSRVQTI